MKFLLHLPRLVQAAVLVVSVCAVAPAAYSVATAPPRSLTFQAAATDAALTPISHGEPIDRTQCGVRRYYTEIPANGGTGWMRAVSDALVAIDCGDGNPRSAHIVRGASGVVRVFTAWHNIAGWNDSYTGNLSVRCRLRTTQNVVNSCVLTDFQSGTTENSSVMYERYRYHHERGEFQQAFRVSATDWASFAVRCTADAEGRAQLARIANAALPTCGTTGAARPQALPSSTAFVSVGVIRDQCANGAPRRVISDRGVWDSALSARYNACLFSNYTDSGMSGGMLAAITGPDSACAVCVINSEVPGAFRREGVPDMSEQSERFVEGNGQNTGAFHPRF